MRTLRGSADFRGFGSRFPRIDLVVRGSEKNRSIRLVRKWHAYPQIGGRQFAHLGPEVTLAPAHNGRCTRRASSSPRYRQLFRPRLCQPVEMAMGRSESWTVWGWSHWKNRAQHSQNRCRRLCPMQSMQWPDFGVRQQGTCCFEGTYQVSEPQTQLRYKGQKQQFTRYAV